MTDNQQNLTLVENLPNLYYERLLLWYEDQCNHVANNNLTGQDCTKRMEYLIGLPRNHTPKISESSIRTIKKIVTHPLYTRNDQSFNVALLVLRGALSGNEALHLNLGYRISDDINYNLASHDLDFMYNRTYKVLKKNECEKVFTEYSSATHFCVKSSGISEKLDLVENSLGKPLLNGYNLYGFVLQKKITLNEQGTDQVLLIINTAKFISFIQGVEAGQDMDTIKKEIQSMTWSLVQNIVKRMMFV